MGMRNVGALRVAGEVDGRLILSLLALNIGIGLDQLW